MRCVVIYAQLHSTQSSIYSVHFWQKKEAKHHHQRTHDGNVFSVCVCVCKIEKWKDKEEEEEDTARKEKEKEEQSQREKKSHRLSNGQLPIHSWQKKHKKKAWPRQGQWQFRSSNCFPSFFCAHELDKDIKNKGGQCQFEKHADHEESKWFWANESRRRRFQLNSSNQNEAKQNCKILRE